MKCINKVIMLSFLVMVSVVFPRQVSFAQEPVLENYGISHGGTLGGPAGGVLACISDAHFGNGDAKALLTLRSGDNGSTVRMRVWRRLKPGAFSFALLVFRIEITGYDSEGGPVYSKQLPGFTFGDSKSAKWSRLLTRIPPEVRQIKVAFVGNYE